MGWGGGGGGGGRGDEIQRLSAEGFFFLSGKMDGSLGEMSLHGHPDRSFVFQNSPIVLDYVHQNDMDLSWC